MKTVLAIPTEGFRVAIPDGDGHLPADGLPLPYTDAVHELVREGRVSVAEAKGDPKPAAEPEPEPEPDKPSKRKGKARK